MADSHKAGPLPDYANPPVVETILGVQFDRLPGFRNGHLGAFWKTLDAAEWPAILDASPLLPQFETFAESARWAMGGLQLTMTQELPGRLQIKNKAGDRMIQIQNGRLHFNWLGEAGRAYPRYEKVRDGFVWALQQFLAFVVEEKLGELRPNQWELTYLNHIPKGTVWNSPADWAFFRPLGAVPTVEDLVDGESFDGQWHFVIPKQRGRLHVQWQHARKPEPKEEELIVLTLTARGPLDPSKADIQPIAEGLDLGHETIVRSFQELMTDNANKYWGQKHDNR
jgi:uncharacterized protein (TIGR04255 family)